jgi:hypothetical protein
MFIRKPIAIRQKYSYLKTSAENSAKTLKKYQVEWKYVGENVLKMEQGNETFKPFEKMAETMKIINLNFNAISVQNADSRVKWSGIR